MPQPVLQLPDPLSQALQHTQDDAARPVIVLVLDPQQRLLSWRHLTLAEAATVIAMHQNPEITNGSAVPTQFETR
jgi:hypothetical protein